MPDDANVELRFTATQDTSVRQSFSVIESLLGRLLFQLKKTNNTLKSFENGFKGVSKPIATVNKQVDDSAKKIEKQKKAIEDVTVRSTTYEQILKKLMATYRAGSAEFGRAVQALEQTERAFQRNQKAADNVVGSVARLDAAMKAWQTRKDHAEMTGLTTEVERADRAIAKLQDRINVRKSAGDYLPAKSSAAFFDYTKEFDKNLAKLQPSVDTLTKKFTAIGERVDWVGEHMKYLGQTFKTGSYEQQQGLQILNDAWKDYQKTLKDMNRLIQSAQSKTSNLTGEELNRQQTVINELNQLKTAVVGSFSSDRLKGMEVYTPAVEQLTRAYKNLITSQDEFGKYARTSYLAYAQQKISANELSDRLLALGTSYKLYTKELDKARESGKYSAEQLMQLSSASSQLQAMNVKTAAGMKTLFYDISGLSKTITPASQAIESMASSIKTMAEYTLASMVGGAVIGSFFKAVTAAKEYDQALKNLQAITGATNPEIAMLGEEIKKVAVETRYGMKEVADGATIIGQAGFSATETMAVLGSTMQLAQGTMSSVATSADLLTTVISSFNLNATDAAMVADSMASAVNYSKLNIDKLRTAFNYIGPVAMDAGVSLNEMTAALMVLANNGMKASTIGTSLRNVFSQLQSPSKALRQAFKGNDEDLLKLQQDSVSLVDKFGILNKQLGTSADLYKMFGLRAAGTVSILMRYPEQLRAMEQSLLDLGNAERMAQKQMEGFGNRVKNLGAAIEVFAVTVMERPSGALSMLTLRLTQLVQLLTEAFNGALGDAVAALGTFAAAAGGLTLAYKTFTAVFGASIVDMIRTFGEWILKVASFFKVKTAATVADTAAIGLNTVATTANTTAEAACNAVRVAATGLTEAHTVATKANTAAVAANAVATGGLSAAIRAAAASMMAFLANPIVLGLTAIGLAIAGVTIYYSKLRDAEDKEFKASAKLLKQKQDQIGLLRTALRANEQITDETQRIRNTAYLSEKIPDIADVLLQAQSKEDVRAVLQSRLNETEADLLEIANKKIEEASAKLQSLRQERIDIAQWYSDAINQGIAEINIDPAAISGMEDEWNNAVATSFSSVSIEELTKQFQKKMNDNTKLMKQWEDEIRNNFNSIDQVARNWTNDVVVHVKEAGSSLSGEDLIQTFTDTLNGLVTIKGDKTIELLKDLSVLSFKLANNVSVSTASIENLEEAMTSNGLAGDKLKKIFEGLSSIVQAKFITAVQKYIQEREKINKQNIADAEKEKQLAALRQEFYNEIVKNSTDTYSKEVSWLELIRKKRIATATASVTEEKARKEEIDRINKDIYTQESNQLKASATEQIAYMAELSGLTFPANTIKILLDLDQTAFNNLPKAVRDAIMSNSALQLTIGKFIDLQGQIAAIDNQNDKTTRKPSFGSAERKTIDSLKSELDYKNKLEELSYQRGLITYEEYNNKKLANDRQLLDKRKELVDKLIQKAGNDETNLATAKKERMAYLKDEAEYALQLEKQVRENKIHSLDIIQKEEESRISTREALLNSTDMLDMAREEELARLSIDRLNAEISRLTAIKEITTQQDDLKQLELDIQDKLNEKVQAEYDLRKKIFENQNKYIETEVKLGLRPSSDYRNYIQNKMSTGEMNPYEGYMSLLATSDNPLDGVKRGFMEAATQAKTFNEYISEGVTELRSGMLSAVDNFVDSWWDGTKSASDVWKDFVEDIIKTWQKKIMEGFMDTIFTSFTQKIVGKDSGLASIFSTLGGGRTATASTGGLLSNLFGAGTSNQPAVNTDPIASSVNAFTSNITSNLALTTNNISKTVEQATTESLMSITGMTDGASSLWSYLSSGFSNFWTFISNGFNSLWSAISSLFSSSGGGGSWFDSLLNLGFKAGMTFLGGGAGSGAGGFDFSGGYTSNLAGGLALSSNFGKIAFAKGGIFRSGMNRLANSVVGSPTFIPNAVVAMANGGALIGEAGPEAVMPLTRAGNGKLGVDASGAIQPCINNIYIETPEGYTAEEKSRQANDNGGEDIMFAIVKNTARETATPGSPMYRAMQNTFGASQVLTAR